LIGTLLVCTDYDSCTQAAIVLMNQQLTIVYAVLFSLLGLQVLAVISAFVTISEMRRGRSLYQLYEPDGARTVVPTPARAQPTPQRVAQPTHGQQEMASRPSQDQGNRVVIEETRRYVM
jgi:hypothetical protein